MNLKKLLDQMEDDVTEEEASLFHTQPLTASHYSILAILTELPILLRPTLKWLQVKKAQLSAAQITTLYTTNELKQMYSEEEWNLFEQTYLKKEE